MRLREKAKVLVLRMLRDLEILKFLISVRVLDSISGGLSITKYSPLRWLYLTGLSYNHHTILRAV